MSLHRGKQLALHVMRSKHHAINLHFGGTPCSMNRNACAAGVWSSVTQARGKVRIYGRGPCRKRVYQGLGGSGKIERAGEIEAPPINPKRSRGLGVMSCRPVGSTRIWGRMRDASIVHCICSTMNLARQDSDGPRPMSPAG